MVQVWDPKNRKFYTISEYKCHVSAPLLSDFYKALSSRETKHWMRKQICVITTAHTAKRRIRDSCIVTEVSAFAFSLNDFPSACRRSMCSPNNTARQ